MSKKLIAIASAAALALAGLVSAPAFAVGLDVNQTTNTKSTALTAQVPELGALDLTDTTVRFEVTASDDEQTVKFTASEGVKFAIAKDFADADDNDPALSAGRTSYTKILEAENDTVEVWAYNTSTTAGKLVITSGDNQNTYWVKGLVGGAYNMTVKFPSSIPTSGTDGATVTAVVSDVFGNAITGSATGNAGTGSPVSGLTNDVDGDLEITLVGADFVAGGLLDNWTWDAKKKNWESDGIIADDSGPVAIRVDLTSDGTDKPDLTDGGFAKAKSTAFTSVDALSLEDQVASLTAKLANTVSKAKYNNLVKKYNKITRGKKASLVK
jgi:hypothetical protein